MLLFLGSGVSLDSGLPSVVEITDHLLEGDVDEPLLSSDQRPGSMEKARRLLRLLASLDGHYLETIAPWSNGDHYEYTGSIYRSSTSYEDLFHLCEQVRHNCQGLTDDAQTGAFVDLLENRAGDLLEGKTRDERIIYLYHLSHRASQLIEQAVASQLRAGKVVGLDLVLRLAQSERVNRLDIITLNHDTLVEQLLAENGVSFVDGFGSLDDAVRWYNHKLFDTKDAKVRIIKPHGSVNWYSFLVDGRQRQGILDGYDDADGHNESGKSLELHNKKPSFLSGANKMLAYNKGIYAEMFYRFHQVLREQRFMIMSGYGWSDSGINFRLIDWLERNRSHSLYLLHRDPESLVSNSLQLNEYYSALVSAYQIIPGNQWLSDTTLDDVWFARKNKRA